MDPIRRFVGANRALSRAAARRYRGFFEERSYRDEMLRRVESDLAREPGDVLEVGGIDRPMLKRNAEFHYDGMDIDEKPRCHELYDRFLVQSIERPVERGYRMILSFTLLEHVRDNRAALDSIYRALEPGGTTHHYVPSRNHPYALCLRLLGRKLQRSLIAVLRPDSVGETGYPAFFDHCSPRAMAGLLTRIGFCEITITPYYRANDYFAFCFPAFVLVTAFENLCRRFGWSRFASGFVMSARRPGEP